MKIAILFSFIMVGSFLFGFYVLSPLFPFSESVLKTGQISQKKDITNQSMTNNEPSYGWGWSDDYCLRKLMLKDTSIILIPRCEF